MINCYVLCCPRAKGEGDFSSRGQKEEGDFFFFFSSRVETGTDGPVAGGPGWGSSGLRVFNFMASTPCAILFWSCKEKMGLFSSALAVAPASTEE